MSSAAEPFCPSCGEVLPVLASLHAQVAEQAEEIETLIETRRGLENDLAAKRSQIERMKGQRNRQRQQHPLAGHAQEVFEYWRKRLAPRAREFDGERFDKVVARLRAGFDVDELERAIDGYARRPYVVNGQRVETGRSDQRYTDLELICRDEKHVFNGITIADAYDAVAQDVEAHVSSAKLEQLQNAISEGALARLQELKCWTPEAIRRLGIGFDGSRLVFPLRDAGGTVVGLARYQPNPQRRGSSPKLIATGSRELFPAPEDVDAKTVWLVEGEPDSVSMWSMVLPAIAVPGVATWKDGWADRFAKFDRVIVCFDCDEEGRKAAEARLRAVAAVTTCQQVDLDPTRHDSYDVGDLLVDRNGSAAAHLAGLATMSGGVTPIQPRLGVPPFGRVIRALEDHGCTVKQTREGMVSSQCPVPEHGDRNPSLSVTEGDDQRVLLHCHAGCEPSDVVAALSLEWKELFAA